MEKYITDEKIRLSQNTLLRQPFHLFVYRYSGRTGRKRHLNAISVRVISRTGADDDPVNVLVFLLGVNGKPARLDLAAKDQIHVAPVRLIILKAAVIFEALQNTAPLIRASALQALRLI